MHDNLGHHASKKVPEQTDSKSKACPIMPVFHGLQRIPFKVHCPVEVHLMKRLHGNFVLAMVSLSILFISKFKIVLCRTPRISSLFIFPW